MRINEEKLLKLRRPALILSTVLIAAAVIFLIAGAVLAFEKQKDIYSVHSSADNSSREESVDASTSGSRGEEAVSDASEHSTVPANAEVSEEEVFHGWIINEYGYTYVYSDSGYEQFNYKQTALERYVKALNTFAACAPEKARLFNMIAPVSTTFADIPRDIYKADEFFNMTQSGFISEVASKLDKRFVNIDVLPSISALYDSGDNVFLRTDRNWTSAAAYAAYADFCSSAGISRYSANSFPKFEAGEFLGSFYIASKAESLKNNPDRLEVYSPLPAVSPVLTVYSGGKAITDCIPGKNPLSDKRGNVYFGREGERYSIRTAVSNGKKLLMIGDSSSHPLAMLLCAHYSVVEIIDPTKFNEPFEEYLTNGEFDDILTVCYTTGAVNGDYVPMFNLMTGATDESK